MKTPKILKVMYNGDYLCKIYPYATKWEVFKYRLAIYTRRTLMGLFALGLLYGAFFTGRVTTSPIFVNAEDKSQYMFDSKIDTLKDNVVNEILSCESAGHSEDSGIVVFDTNGKGSFGQLQFQKDTVIHYYKILYGKTITGKEAIAIAMDTQKARELAKDIMFNTKNKAGKDWVNCARKFDSDKQIDLIKKME